MKPIPKLSPSDLKRFWAKVDKTSHPNGCWIWLGAKTNGQGIFFAFRKLHSAAKISFLIQTGKMPQEQIVKTCGEFSCVNSEHLELIRDRIMRWQQRFFAKIKPGPVHPYDPNLGNCADWIGGKSEVGYGQFMIDGRQYLAHRISYEIHNGKIPDGLLIRHSCDRPCCQAAAHLLIGNNKDNVADMISRGRANYDFGEHHGSKTHPERIERGSARWNAVATEEIAIEIRRRYAEESISQRELGEDYNLHQMTVSDIIRRKTWTHV